MKLWSKPLANKVTEQLRFKFGSVGLKESLLPLLDSILNKNERVNRLRNVLRTE